ncbi:hypothetical protein BDN70DRAFT_926039, partial [Pholiota conissans]
MDLLDFPSELLIKILANLDAGSLTRCAMTCRQIHETLKNTSELTFIIESHFNGVTYADALRQQDYPKLIGHLQRDRQLWISSQWKFHFSLAPIFCHRLYDLVGDIIVRLNMQPQYLEVTTLPSNDTTTPTTKKVQCREFAFISLCFAMDPSQDLIVILQRNTWEPEVICRIHFRTLSNDVPHPLAPHTLKFSIITKEPNSDINSICDPVLSIADNILMLKFHVGDGLHGQKELRVMIWDWKSAEPKMDVPTFSDFTVPSFPANSSLGLLNPSYFFVTSISGNGSIRLYRIVKYSTIHVATLNFPTILRFTRICRLYAHSGPIEARRKPNSTFLMCDDDRLHVLVIHYFCEDHEKHIAIPVNLYVHQRVLMKYCVQETRSDGKHLD